MMTHNDGFLVVQSKKKENKKNKYVMDNINKYDKKEYPLLRNWYLGYINGKKMPKQNCSSDIFAKSLKKIGSFNDVLTMWSYFNHIDIKLLGLNSCLYVFEDNILPMWEDKNNIGGNVYKSYINDEYINDIFIKLLLLIVGEILCDEKKNIISGGVNGIYVKKSFKTFEFQVWTKKNSKKITDILLDTTETEWKCINIK